jgi:hypothetical protein
MVIRFNSVSKKACKVYLLLKDLSESRMQCYTKDLSEQNEESDIPHFDVY